jgi:hypothetical protein
MRAAPVLGVLIAAAALVGASPARRPPSDRALILKGLTQAVDTGRLDPAEADAYRALVGRASALIRRLPPGRAVELRGVLHDVAAQRAAYTRPRALTLFTTLELNEDQLASHPLPEPRTDVRDAEGVVYRYFAGHGFVFHPLAEFAALNAAVSSGDEEAVSTLVQALLLRAVPVRGGALTWEYEFPFSGGRPPWTSGMAQAVAAQSLARAGDLLSDASLLDASDAAYAAVPRRLVRELPAGPWIRLYSFARAPVLNAQLQTIVSLDDYAAITGDAPAAALVERLKAAAKALLPRFDTGYWSLYSLAGEESTRSYHEYVISLLRTLSNRDGDPIWKQSADRFARYEAEPPLVKPGRPVPTLYPVPADGYLDVARFRFWLSKRSHVTLKVAGTSRTLLLGHGPHVLEWAPESWQLGLYHPYLRTVDQNGHAIVLALEPLLVQEDVDRPQLDVEVAPPATVSWTSTDEGTPWLALAVHLDAGPKHRVLKLGRRGRTGTVALLLPAGRWHARLVAVNSAGRLRSVSLGFLPR